MTPTRQACVPHDSREAGRNGVPAEQGLGLGKYPGGDGRATAQNWAENVPRGWTSGYMKEAGVGGMVGASSGVVPGIAVKT